MSEYPNGQAFHSQAFVLWFVPALVGSMLYDLTTLDVKKKKNELLENHGKFSEFFEAKKVISNG